MQLHTRGSWPARDDRRIMLFWLGYFLLIVVSGFLADLRNYFHETPPVPGIVHVHVVVTTVWLLILTAQVLLVETDNVKLHRKLGWLAAGWAVVLIVLAAWGELSWEAKNLHKPGITSAFLSISMGGLICFVILMAWGLKLRKNPAAHRRVIFLANVSIITAGFIRLMGNFTSINPTNVVSGFFYYYSSTIVILLLMFLWDWRKGRLMQQFVVGAALILCAHACSITLFFNPGWAELTRVWLEAWAKFAL